MSFKALSFCVVCFHPYTLIFQLRFLLYSLYTLIRNHPLPSVQFNGLRISYVGSVLPSSLLHSIEFNSLSIILQCFTNTSTLLRSLLRLHRIREVLHPKFPLVHSSLFKTGVSTIPPQPEIVLLSGLEPEFPP